VGHFRDSNMVAGFKSANLLLGLFFQRLENEPNRVSREVLNRYSTGTTPLSVCVLVETKQKSKLQNYFKLPCATANLLNSSICEAGLSLNKVPGISF